jgi:hypothetical protein
MSYQPCTTCGPIPTHCGTLIYPEDPYSSPYSAPPPPLVLEWVTPPEVPARGGPLFDVMDAQAG